MDSASRSQSSNYYLTHSSDLMKQFDKMIKKSDKAIALHLGNEVGKVLDDARHDFEANISEIPYIGGKKNPLTETMVQSAVCLSLYRALKRNGNSGEEAGQMILDSFEAILSSYPKVFLRLHGRMQFTKYWLNKVRKGATESQKALYPGAWVFTFVEGDGNTFDWGTDYSECGICKFFEAQGASELTPYLCQTDFILDELEGTGLVRTETIADGGTKCDFRLKRHS